eukprot:gb/GEZN01007946.1/.p1 GENE.gb/GEZN01007946.1/~~gb/GEZN01007946.1/.p1  ORF type:complete len:396 (-),score=44.91 gb/GEZN01007946.1/:236-1423(-)
MPLVGKSQRCVRLVKYGPAREALRLDTMPLPKLHRDELRVQLKALAVNPLDCWERRGYGRELLHGFFKPLPVVLGRDGSGIVVEVGQDVWGYKVGDGVMIGIDPLRTGTYSEFVSAQENEVGLKAPSFSHEQAACLPFASMASWAALTRARLAGDCRSNQPKKVLLHGAGGSLGSSALQMLVANGHAVTTTSGHSSHERLRSLGARRTLLLSRSAQKNKFNTPTFNEEQAMGTGEEPANSTPGVEAQLLQLGQDGYHDVLIDLIGGQQAERMASQFINKGGYFLTVRGPMLQETDNQGVPRGLLTSVQNLMFKKAQFFLTQGVDYDWILARASKGCMKEIERLSAEGKMKIVQNPLQFEGLESIVDAHELFDQSHFDSPQLDTANWPGKLIVTLR